jgi:hypothetical protein
VIWYLTPFLLRSGRMSPPVRAGDRAIQRSGTK